MNGLTANTNLATTNSTTTNPTPEVKPTPAYLRQANLQRKRPQTTEQEEASAELRLGDFQHLPSLSISEARLVINHIFETRKTRGQQITHIESSSMSEKMQDHMDAFARFKNQEVAQQVAKLLEDRKELATFERSQLANLVPGDADEAKTLIPSLNDKIGDAELDGLLFEILNQLQMNSGEGYD